MALRALLSVALLTAFSLLGSGSASAEPGPTRPASTPVAMSGPTSPTGPSTGPAGPLTSAADQPVTQAVSPRHQWGYLPVTPARLLDTRPGEKTVDGRYLGGGKLGPGGYREVAVAGRAGLPAAADIAAVVVNITGIMPSSGTFLSAVPLGTAGSAASNLNLAGGEVAANLAVVPTGHQASIRVYNAAGSTDVALDVVGYFRTAAVSDFSGATPLRLMDTRAGEPTFDGQQTGAGAIGPKATRAVNLSRPGLSTRGLSVQPGDVVVLNVTGVQPTAGTFLTVYPGRTTRGDVSNVNLPQGSIIPNLVFARVGSDGTVLVYNEAGSTHVIVDLAGVVDGEANIVALDGPARYLDTRSSGGALGPGATRTVKIGGTSQVPAGARAAVISLTAVSPTVGTFVAVYPGSARPTMSNLNAPAGAIRASSAVVPLAADGTTTIYNAAGRVQVLVDVVGFVMQSDPVVTGHVLQANGSSLPGAVVTLTSTLYPYSTQYPGSVRVVADSRGYYQANLPAPGGWTACSTGVAGEYPRGCWTENGTGPVGDTFGVWSYSYVYPVTLRLSR